MTQEYTDYDSDLTNDQQPKLYNQQATPKQQQQQQQQNNNTVYEQTHKYSQYQKSEKTHQTKQFKQANSLWTNHQSPNDENLPDLMQDSEDIGTQHQNNSNLNNNIQKRLPSGQGLIIQGQMGMINSPQQQQQQGIILNQQQQYYINNNSLQTGVFRQLVPYNGSSLVNAVPTASFSPDDGHNNNNYKYTQDDENKLLYSEGVTGRISAKIKCKNCDQIIQTLVKFEPGQATNICSMILCILTCTLCCMPYILDQCKDAVHYCPNCGFVLGVKKF